MDITIPETYNDLPVKAIGAEAFRKYTSLTSVTIGNNITSIGDHAFYDCDNLINITIPDSVTSIGDYAFEGCTSITNIRIPDSVTSIGDNAFEFCKSLIDINVSVNNNNYQSINGNLYSKDGMTLIQYSSGKKDNEFIIPKGVTSIGDRAFSNCRSLTSINIPDSVTSIGESAFYECYSLMNIIIPESVTSIGSGAFSDCYSLTIYCEVSSKPSSWAYYWNNTNCPVVWGYK